MKFYSFFISLLLLAVTGTFFSCSEKQTDRADGWYTITGNAADSLSREPIVTYRDFVDLRLDSSVNEATGDTLFVIIGKTGKQGTERFAEATEKSIGKCIAFVFDNTIISAPQVNMRIDSGNFMISSRKGDDIPLIYRTLKEEKIEASREAFPQIANDPALSAAQKDSVLFKADLPEIK